MPSDNNHFATYLRLHFLVFISGFTGVIREFIDQSSLTIALFRMLIGALAIYFFLRNKNRLLEIRQVPFKAAIFNGFLIGAHWYTFFESIALSNVSVALVVLSAGSFFSALLEPIVLKQKLNFGDLGVGTLVIAILYYMFQTNMQFQSGFLVAVLSTFFAALFTVNNGKILRNTQPIPLSFVQMLSGGLILLIVFLFTESPIEWLHMRFQDVFWILVFGLVFTAWAFTENIALLKKINPFTMMLAYNLEPVYAILFAGILFSDYKHLNISFYVGATLLFLVILSRGFLKMRARKKSEKQKTKQLHDLENIL